MELHIRQAGTADLQTVLAVLDDAAGWLQSIGVTEQWPPSFSEDPKQAEQVRGWVESGGVYVAEAEGVTTGVFRLLEHDNPRLWPDVETPALYLHSLAVVRAAAAQGVGAAILDWASDRARATGKRLRLDCWSGNDRLRTYYAAAAFQPVGDAVALEINGREYGVARFERR